FNFRRASVDWQAKSRTAVRGEIDHALEITEFMIGLEVAIRRRGNLQMIFFDEILATIAPEETRASKRPYQWPVALRWKGNDVVIHPTPDRIFGIRDLERREGQNRKFFFLEADRGTMPTVNNTAYSIRSFVPHRGHMIEIKIRSHAPSTLSRTKIVLPNLGLRKVRRSSLVDYYSDAVGCLTTGSIKRGRNICCPVE